MNGIFIFSLAFSSVILLFISPESFLTALTSAGEKTVELAITLFTVYLVWLGFFKVLNESGLNKSLSKLLKKPVSFLFKTSSEGAEEYLSSNLSANLLGLGGLATPTGIEAMMLMEEEGNEFGKEMLFVISATSIQLIPTSILQLRASLNSVNASSIILPTIIGTFLSTFTGIILLKIFYKANK